MHIELMGTGSIWAKALGSCALIDHTILLDCPNGLIKRLKNNKTDIKKIDICIITHFHADHYFDIPFLLLEQGMHHIREEAFVFIGPSGLAERIDTLFRLAYPELWEKVKKNAKIKVIEITEEKTPVYFEQYTIIPYKMDHNGMDAYGYTIEKNGKVAGFTGDTLFCPNVEEIIQKSNIVFTDMSFEKNSKAHMGFNNIISLKQKYAGKSTIIPTHMSDCARDAYKKVFSDIPVDGTCFDV